MIIIKMGSRSQEHISCITHLRYVVLHGIWPQSYGSAPLGWICRALWISIVHRPQIDKLLQLNCRKA